MVCPHCGEPIDGLATIPLSDVEPGLIDGKDLVAKLLEFNRRNGPLKFGDGDDDPSDSDG